MDTILRFPTHTIFGRIFNDYLDGLPMLDIYKHYSTLVSEDKETTILLLKEAKGWLYINYENDVISNISCDIFSDDTRNELYDYVKENMEPIKVENKLVRAYSHSSGITFATFVYSNDECIRDSFFLYNTKV